MRTARPFDKSGLHGAVRAEGNYNDMSEFHGRKFSAFVSNTWDTVGLLVGAVYSDTKTRSDALNYNSYTPDYPGTWPTDGTGVPVVGECCISFGSVVDQKKRSALTATLEWRPSDTLHVTLDGLYTHLDDPQVAYNQAYFPQFTFAADGVTPLWSNVVVNNGLVTSFTESNFTPEIVNQTVARKVNTSQRPAWPAPTITKVRGSSIISIQSLVRSAFALLGQELALREDPLLPARLAVKPAVDRPFGEHRRAGLEVARLPGFGEFVFVGVVLDQPTRRAAEVPEVGRRDRMPHHHGDRRCH